MHMKGLRVYQVCGLLPRVPSWGVASEAPEDQQRAWDAR